MNRIQKNNISNISNGIVKRIGICILCCLPIMVLIGFWLQDLNSVARIAIFTLFMLVVVAIEEYIHIKIAAKKQLMDKVLHKDEDVFK